MNKKLTCHRPVNLHCDMTFCDISVTLCDILWNVMTYLWHLQGWFEITTPTCLLISLLIHLNFTLAIAMPEIPAPMIRTSRFCLATFAFDLKVKGRAGSSTRRPIRTPTTNQNVLFSRWITRERRLELFEFSGSGSSWLAVSLSMGKRWVSVLWVSWCVCVCSPSPSII